MKIFATAVVLLSAAVIAFAVSVFRGLLIRVLTTIWRAHPARWGMRRGVISRQVQRW
jgi:hypothetical protein